MNLKHRRNEAQKDSTSDSGDVSGTQTSAQARDKSEPKSAQNNQDQSVKQPSVQACKMAEIRVATLLVHEQVQQKLVDVFKSKLDAFAASLTDLGKTPTTRVDRWIFSLSQNIFKLECQRGQDDVSADMLSRLPFVSAHEVGLQRIHSTPAVVPEEEREI